MRQNAMHLIYTFGIIMGTMLLPITFGLIAVLRDGLEAPEAKRVEAKSPAEGAGA